MAPKSDRSVLAFGPSYREVEVGDIAYLAKKTPLKLDSGAEISDFPIAYRTYGTLNEKKSNAILVCHGLTADQYMLETHPVTGKPGWWDLMGGAGKPLDTEKYFLIVPNVLGGCLGTFGPKLTDPKTKKPYALQFPVITIADMVRAQALLVEALGVTQLHAVIGGSMGGMQALTWASLYPQRLRACIAMSTAARHTAQNIAFHEIGRQAIMADPDWAEGNYLAEKRYPSKGLAVARMTAHVTYLSQSALHRKFGRQLQNREHVSYGFDADFQVESYLRHQGNNFVERFDPNSYLYITRAMDYFDLVADHGGSLQQAFQNCDDLSFCIISFSSDWLFPTEESLPIVHSLHGHAKDVAFVEIESDKGHDAFLLDEPELRDTITGFLKKLENLL